MTRLYLVRHGTHALVGKVPAGRMPGVSLSEEGRAQAERLAAHFAGEAIGAVLSSPLERCQETAAPIASRQGCPVGLEPALTELHCGRWTGQAFTALTQDPAWRRWNAERGQTAVPEGESIQAVEARVMGLLERLEAAAGAPTILVTHSDVIKVAMLSLLGASLDLHDRVEIDPASVTTIELWRGGGKIVRSNATVPA